MRLLPPKKNTVFSAVGIICLVTVVFFFLSMVKAMEVDVANAQHPLEAAFAGPIYLSGGLGMLWLVGLLLASFRYALLVPEKSRSGMVLASGLLVLSIASVVWGWGVSIGIWAEVETDSPFVAFVTDAAQIINFLPAACYASVAYLLGWKLCTPLARKLFRKKRTKLDTPEKKRGYRRYLQAWSLILVIFTLAILPLTSYALQNTYTHWGFLKLTRRWYVGAWVHGISGVIAGIELIVGIRFLLDRAKGKVSLGALLLGSSFLSFFILWFCYYLIMDVVFGWGFGHYNAYAGSMLFVILHRIVSAVLVVIDLLSGRRKRTT